MQAGVGRVFYLDVGAEQLFYLVWGNDCWTNATLTDLLDHYEVYLLFVIRAFFLVFQHSL